MLETFSQRAPLPTSTVPVAEPMEKTLLILIIPPLPVSWNVPPFRKIVRAACEPSAVGSVTPRPCVAIVPPLSQILPVNALATPP